MMKGLTWTKREVTLTDQVVTAVSCTNCQVALTPVLGEWGDGDQRGIQPLGALEITLHGGYGMFFDDEYSPLTVYFCEQCARQLMSQFPGLRLGEEEDLNGSTSSSPSS